MKSSDTSRATSQQVNEKSEPPAALLPDLPLPTPPPMANIMMTSRFDLQTRGGCGYRRILSSRSTEFRSPILGRSSSVLHNAKDLPSSRQVLLPGRQFGSVHDRLGLSPLPRHKNFEDLSVRLEDFDNYKKTLSPPSKYLSKDSVLSQEIEEVNNLTHELRNKFGDCYNTAKKENEISPEYQSVCYNEHYMSDIDENEEIKQFSYGYKTSERRFSDHSERSDVQQTERSCSYNTLPTMSSFKCIKSIAPSQFVQVSRSLGSSSSIKSSDYCSPLAVKKVEFAPEFTQKIIKTPYRPVVKIAKIR